MGDGVFSVLGLSCSLQDDTPVCLRDCLVVNGTSTSIIYIYLHGTAARVLTSGHPPETRSRVLTSGHPPGTQKHKEYTGADYRAAKLDWIRLDWIASKATPKTMAFSCTSTACTALHILWQSLKRDPLTVALNSNYYSTCTSTSTTTVP